MRLGLIFRETGQLLFLLSFHNFFKLLIPRLTHLPVVTSIHLSNLFIHPFSHSFAIHSLTLSSILRISAFFCNIQSTHLTLQIKVVWSIAHKGNTHGEAHMGPEINCGQNPPPSRTLCNGARVGAEEFRRGWPQGCILQSEVCRETAEERGREHGEGNWRPAWSGQGDPEDTWTSVFGVKAPGHPG